MTVTSIRSVRWIRVSDVKSLSLPLPPPSPIYHIFPIPNLLWKQLYISAVLTVFGFDVLMPRKSKVLLQSTFISLDNGAFRKACDVLVASNTRDENELSLLRGSLIAFLHLFKLGCHPLGKFPAYSTRVKAISVAALSNFLLQGTWMQFSVHMFIYHYGTTQTSECANKLGGTVLVAI